MGTEGVAALSHASPGRNLPGNAVLTSAERARESNPQFQEPVMRKTFAMVAACALFAGTAAAQTTVSTDDFVKKVAISDMFEIQSSQLIAPKADADTKPFAERMVKDHTKTSNQLKSLVKSGKVKAALPTKLDPEHQAKLDELKKLKGKQLDSAYDEMQVQAHQEAVDL